ncbi:hypothetical protein OG897_24325 [Streptomyces sp. NBC_00237]|uniref:hypothetical protein n=1 Tax=Streptomyces sp. NBC_00237 TaxID=2975687 RepID=UPI00225917AA|nr:hypothetical protein [Streptomyces sp. NBC_00237]MCX5204568.1 hypothetical protein [Streptomyces sp. NBC_00237]
MELAPRYLCAYPSEVVPDDVPDEGTGTYLLRAFEETRCAVVLTSRGLSARGLGLPEVREHEAGPLRRGAAVKVAAAAMERSPRISPWRYTVEEMADAAGGLPASLWLASSEELSPFGAADRDNLYRTAVARLSSSESRSLFCATRRNERSTHTSTTSSRGSSPYGGRRPVHPACAATGASGTGRTG